MMLIFLAMVFAFFDVSTQDVYPTAEIAWGKIRGHYKYSYHNRMYSAFEGIPYAKPPIADLRFVEPQEPEPWNDVLNATKLHRCPQIILMYPQSGEEDCLYVNVYVPRTEPIPKENLNVVVHVHGGGFLFGDTQIGGPKYLMDRDIVFVNFNYRLGIFGFLSTDDEALPGNLGLKDQVFALKWIQKNIEYFGGNPNSVTVTGLSAGSCSVHLHYLSPLSKGLFHRGMSQSGVAVAPWTIQAKPLENAIALGNSVGCTNSSTKDLVKCLKTKSVQELYNNVGVFYVSKGIPVVPLGVVIEKPSSTAFLTDHPYALLKKGQIHDIPWLTSITTDEGLIGLTFIDYELETFATRFEHILPYLLYYNHLENEKDISAITTTIKKHYFKEDKMTQQEYTNLFRDALLANPFETAVRLQSKATASPVFTYVYGYKNSFRNRNWFGKHPEGVDHTEDATLLYDMSLMDLILVPKELSESDVFIKDVLLDMVTSYADDGVPKCKHVNWTPVNGNDDIRYLFIENSSSLSMKQANEFTPTSFWSSLPTNNFDNFVDTKEEL